MHPFVIGQEYARPRLLEFLGSKQMQSGVLWGQREPGCIICTSGGRHGKHAGYVDQPLEDGCWWYYGQGQSGDQSLENSANAKLASLEKSVLLFTSREPTRKEVTDRGGYGKLFTFKGSFNVLGFETVSPDEGSRKGEKLLRFHLVPADSEFAGMDEQLVGDMASSGLGELQQQLQAKPPKVGTSLTIREYRVRSSQVKRYALLRASGVCEGCHEKAPFVDSDGKPFLEVHHLLRLADDGPDAPANVAALCPNCHRRAHHSIDREEFGAKLRALVREVEEKVTAQTVH